MALPLAAIAVGLGLLSLRGRGRDSSSTAGDDGCPGNSPPPPHLRVMRGVAHPELQAWAASLVHDPQTQVGDFFEKLFNGRLITARVEHHSWTTHGAEIIPGCFKGVTLYECRDDVATAGEADPPEDNFFLPIGDGQWSAFPSGDIVDTKDLPYEPRDPSVAVASGLSPWDGSQPTDCAMRPLDFPPQYCKCILAGGTDADCSHFFFDSASGYGAGQSMLPAQLYAPWPRPYATAGYLRPPHTYHVYLDSDVDKNGQAIPRGNPFTVIISGDAEIEVANDIASRYFHSRGVIPTAGGGYFAMNEQGAPGRYFLVWEVFDRTDTRGTFGASYDEGPVSREEAFDAAAQLTSMFPNIRAVVAQSPDGFYVRVVTLGGGAPGFGGLGSLFGERGLRRQPAGRGGDWGGVLRAIDRLPAQIGRVSIQIDRLVSPDFAVGGEPDLGVAVPAKEARKAQEQLRSDLIERCRCVLGWMRGVGLSWAAEKCGPGSKTFYTIELLVDGSKMSDEARQMVPAAVGRLPVKIRDIGDGPVPPYMEIVAP